jgi:uncharacterized protein with GYD domain
MATFMATITFTEQGLKTIRETTRRAASLRSAAKKFGVKVIDVYWCLGSFDGLLLFQAPDGETATALMLFLSSQGNVKTQTAQIFTAGDMDKILKAIPAK